jgi:hypothetical protein
MQATIPLLLFRRLKINHKSCGCCAFILEKGAVENNYNIFATREKLYAVSVGAGNSLRGFLVTDCNMFVQREQKWTPEQLNCC